MPLRDLRQFNGDYLFLLSRIFRISRSLVLARLARSGISTKTSFDVAPGTYLVREIVRDSEQGQLSGVNRTIEVPF